MNMGNAGGSGPEEKTMFDWEDFQNRFFQEKGWQETLKQLPGPVPWVERYVRGLLNEIVPAAEAKAEFAAKTSRASGVAWNFFETHRTLLVKIMLSGQIDPFNVRIFASPTELLITGLTGEEEKRIKLPVLIRLEGARAICQNRIIELSLPKERGLPRKELPIRHIEN